MRSMAIQTLTFSTAAPKLAWAGDARGILWRSTDGGATWEPAGKVKKAIRAILPDPRSPGALLIASDDGVFGTLAGGGKWTAVLANEKPSATALARPPRNPNLLLAASGGSVQRSDDGGRRWRKTGAFTGDATGLAFHRRGGTAFLATTTELWRSPDDGATWEKQPKFVTGVFQDPLRDNRWYGLDANRPMLDDGAGFQRFDRSLPKGDEGDTVVLVGGSDFVALASKTGVFYRTFCGVDDWTPIERFSADGPNGTVSALAVDPNNWKTWLGADEKGIWRCEDVGKNWTKVAEIR